MVRAYRHGRLITLYYQPGNVLGEKPAAKRWQDKAALDFMVKPNEKVIKSRDRAFGVAMGFNPSLFL
jgi:hypothetical protein